MFLYINSFLQYIISTRSAEDQLAIAAAVAPYRLACQDCPGWLKSRHIVLDVEFQI